MDDIEGLLKQTQSSLLLGGDKFDQERHYRIEICSLEKKLSSNPKCIESIKSWIANYHLLASIYLQRGELLMAQKCYLIPHHSMLYMAKYNQDEESELIAIHAINLTLPALMKFAKEYPPCKKCLNEFKEQMNMIEQNKATYH